MTDADVHRASPLARYLFVGYVLLIVYASLHPLGQWQDSGVRPFTYLQAFWPRYYTRFDIVANVMAYAPLGLLAVGALHPRVRGLWAFVLAVAFGAGLSLSLETLQNYLPSRIPSALDLACNSTGAALGALLSVFLAPRIIGRGMLFRLRHSVFGSGHTVDVGLVLLAGWLFTLLRPESLLFGNGDLRFLFDALPGSLHGAATFVRVEALVTAGNVVAVALLLSLLVAPGGPKRRLFLLLVGGACLVRMLAFVTLFEGRLALAWLTPGAQWGLIIGVPAGLVALALPRGTAVTLCGLLLMAVTALVNLAPDNPYLVVAHQAWYQGHFLNFNGLTRVVSTLWPFAAMVFLLMYGARALNQGGEAAPARGGRL